MPNDNLLKYTSNIFLVIKKRIKTYFSDFLINQQLLLNSKYKINLTETLMDPIKETVNNVTVTNDQVAPCVLPTQETKVEVQETPSVQSFSFLRFLLKAIIIIIYIPIVLQLIVEYEDFTRTISSIFVLYCYLTYHGMYWWVLAIFVGSAIFAFADSF